MDNIEISVDQGMNLLEKYGLPVLWALLTLIIGLFVIKQFTKFLKRTMTKREVSPTLIPFVASIANVALKAMLFITVASMVGIEATSFVAVLGAAGLAVGLALQGSLANFAGGVLIILFKPFKVDDIIEAQGFFGVVQGIHIFNTVLNTLDNKRIIIPNGPLSSGPITNYSAEDTRRVDMEFGIGYDDDLKKAKDILTKLMKADDRILT